MKLADLYAAALQDAQARAAQHAEGKGASSWVPLPKGAQFAVQLSGGRICVWLSRQHKPVGYPTEEATFCRHFGVPARARRVDHGRMSDGWYKVSYAWEIAEASAPTAEQEGLTL